MVDFVFNAQQYTPEFGGGGEQLTPGEYTVVIVDSRREPTKDGQGGMLSFDLTPVEGPLAGRKQTIRFNLHNSNAKTVEIANNQLSALCAVIGVPGFNRTEELYNKPFKVKIDWQKGNEPTQEKPNGGYTEVKAMTDLQGNKPGSNNNRPMQAAPNNGGAAITPPGNVGAQGGWGGAGNNGGQPDQNQQQNNQQQQQPNNGGNAGGNAGWGGNNGGGQPDQNQQQQQQPNNGGNAGWGGANQQQQQPNNAGQGWGNS